MTQPNICDLRCPQIAIMGCKYRRDMAARQGNLASMLVAGVRQGVRAAAHAGRSWATCPSRNLPGEEWQPSPACIAEAQQIADGMSATRSELTEHEREVLTVIRTAD